MQVHPPTGEAFFVVVDCVTRHSECSNASPHCGGNARSMTMDITRICALDNALKLSRRAMST